MQSLTQIALQKARDTISQNFADPSSLDEIGVLSLQMEKQLLAAEEQLNGAVQSKLDSLKRAVDLMDESAVKLNILAANINKIDEKIAQTNTAISNYESLKRVHNARDNLSKVIAQVEFFAKVPERAKELKELLDKNPSSLKEVYIESLKYESLRIALVKEIRVSRNRKKSVSGRVPMMTSGYSGHGGDYSEDTFKNIKDAVENHLRIVPELVDEVRLRVFTNISRLNDLASNSPADLVMSFEIIEMQQEYNDRRNKVILANKGPPSDMHEDISAIIQDKIRQLLADRVEGEFEGMANYNDDKLSKVTALIMSANQVLQKMSIFREEVVPCMPPSYEPMLMFIEAFENIFLPRVEDMMKNVEALKVGEILDFINWIEYHKACMEEFQYLDRECIGTLANISGELMTEYKTKIKAQVSNWFDNIKNRPLEISKNTDDTLITSHPEDMFNIIHAQVEVAREKLPLVYTKEVSIACMQVLQAHQRTSYDDLSNLWRSMDPETMCATINDNQRMQEKCEEFGEYLFKFVEEGPEKEILMAILEEVSGEYIAIAVKAVNFLAKCILEDLDDAFFSKLYTPEWESGEDFCEVLTATLSDYFADLSSWLSDYFYSKFVRETLETIINKYIMILRKKSNGAFSFMNEGAVSNRMIADHNIIEEFFSQYSDNLRKGGLRGGAKKSNKPSSGATASIQTLLIDELEPLVNLSKIIGSKQLTSSTEKDAKALFERWGLDGLKVIQSAIFGIPTLSKLERIQGAEAARKLFDKENVNNQYNTVLMEEYAAYDVTAVNSNAVTSAAKDTGTRTFWGRKKQ